MKNPSGAVHPTVFLLVWAVAGFGAGRLWPVPFMPDSLERVLPQPIVLAGVLLCVWSMIEFWRRGTTMEHTRPTTALVTTGPFRYSRNPVYVGLILLMVGLSLVYESPWSLLLVPPVVVAIHHMTVLREETYLERVFGEDYRNYRASVRRWI